MAKRYYVYMATNASRTLYVGMTNRPASKSCGAPGEDHGGFTARYNIGQLVYFEETADVREAIAREKQIKRWSRRKKIALIESLNPTWADLASVDPEG